MKVYEISVADRLYEVIPTADKTGVTLLGDADTTRIYIYPASDCDFAIDADHKNGAGPRDIFAVLSFFFGQVRGLPECELTVRLDGVRQELTIFDTPRGFAVVRHEKCKLLSTNRYALPDATEHTLHTLLVPETIRVIEVGELSAFDPAVLTGLRVLRGLADTALAAAVCFRREYSSALSSPVLTAEAASPDASVSSLTVAAMLASGGTCRSVTVGDTVCTASTHADGSMSVYLPATLLSVTDA